MSTLFHTPITTGAAANAASFNAPLGQLDAALDALDERIGDIETTGYSVVTGNVATLANGAAAAGSVTPKFIGEEYPDSTAVKWYKSTGLTNSDWVALN